MGWTTEESWFDSGQGQDIFVSPSASRPILRPTQLPTHWPSMTLSQPPGGRGVEDSPPPGVDDKNVENYGFIYTSCILE